MSNFKFTILNFKKMKNHSRRGSALIFTLLLIGLVASLSFFVSRSAVREAHISGVNVNSLVAYYAAEAGLEDGLARLAADHSIEVPTCAYNKYHNNDSNNISPCDASDLAAVFNTNLNVADLALASPASLATRVRMARFGPQGAATINHTNNNVLNKVVNYTDQDDSPQKNPNDYMYDLRITSRVLCVGPANAACGVNPADPGTGNDTFIKKDAVKEFAVYSGVDNPETPDSASILWQCSGRSCASTDNLIINLVYQCPVTTLPDQECTKDIVFRSDTASRTATLPIPLGNSLGNLLKIRIKSVSSDTSLAGVNLSMVVKNGSSPVVFKGAVARLQSIGYFGGIKRRLEATIDRNSGALLGLFDYAVYAGQSFIQP